jgi:hypothetical protein
MPGSGGGKDRIEKQTKARPAKIEQLTSSKIFSREARTMERAQHLSA